MKKLLLIMVGIFVFLMILGGIAEVLGLEPRDDEPRAEEPEESEEPEEPEEPEARLGVTKKELKAIISALNMDKNFWEFDRVRADDIAEITRKGYGKKFNENGEMVDDPNYLAYKVVLKNGEEYPLLWINKVMIGE